VPGNNLVIFIPTGALIATTSRWMSDRTAAWRMYEILDAYEKVQPNLLKHTPGYPEASQLRAVIREGIPKFGMEGAGPGQDSKGSDWIISMIDEYDDLRFAGLGMALRVKSNWSGNITVAGLQTVEWLYS
jgi:hypothetical protein